MNQSTALALLLAAAVAACPASASSAPAQGAWAQCGGINWTGGTTCITGWTCVAQNPYYSQCLQSSSSIAASSTATTATVARSSTTSTTVVVTPTTTTTVASVARTTSSTAIVKAASSSSTTTSSSKTSTSTSPASSGTGLTYKASFTHYGAGDSFGSPNCNTNTAACGFYTYPGFSAAASQNLFGVGPGAGAGPACGTCWKLVGQTDSSGNALSNAGTSIVVMVNNLCPADGNPLCSQSGLTGTNQYGANVNFDLCSDSGAEAAFFGSDGVGLAIGSATQVDCSQWSGTVVH